MENTMIEKVIRKATNIQNIVFNDKEELTKDSDADYVLDACKKFVYLDSFFHKWCYREYKEPKIELLNLFNEDMNAKIFILDSHNYKKYMENSFLNYMKLIYCVNSISINYLTDETLDALLSLEEPDNTKSVIYIEPDCSIEKLDSLYHKTRNSSIDVISIVNNTVYRMSKESSELNLKRVYL
jgi:hypothetical protein